jgi:hypothetical protein
MKMRSMVGSSPDPAFNPVNRRFELQIAIARVSNNRGVDYSLKKRANSSAPKFHPSPRDPCIEHPFQEYCPEGWEA